jgi:hypothetical protein
MRRRGEQCWMLAGARLTWAGHLTHTSSSKEKLPSRQKDEHMNGRAPTSQQRGTLARGVAARLLLPAAYGQVPLSGAYLA